jgi:hypothetical protein
MPFSLQRRFTSAIIAECSGVRLVVCSIVFSFFILQYCYRGFGIIFCWRKNFIKKGFGEFLGGEKIFVFSEKGFEVCWMFYEKVLRRFEKGFEAFFGSGIYRPF